MQSMSPVILDSYRCTGAQSYLRIAGNQSNAGCEISQNSSPT